VIEHLIGGKSSTRITSPSQSARNLGGSRWNAAAAMTSSSSSEGALTVRQASGSKNVGLAMAPF
jgi:hypothetical protein